MLGARALVQPGPECDVQLGVRELGPLASQTPAMHLNPQLVELERDATTCGWGAIHVRRMVVGAHDAVLRADLGPGPRPGVYDRSVLPEIARLDDLPAATLTDGGRRAPAGGRAMTEFAA